MGAIRALSEILADHKTPFPILTGVSAGAINAVSLASHADDFAAAASMLWDTWSSITPEQVYRTDVRSLAAIASQWLRELGGGGLFVGSINHLLDTSPLRVLLGEKLRLSAMRDHLARRSLRGVAVSATNYHSGTAVTFYACEPDPSPPIQPWVRSMRLGEPATLRLDHVLASCAIPVFFPPVPIDGAFYGDGCIRLNSPLSPAIHLGAQHIVAIGIRCACSAVRTAELNHRKDVGSPSLSEIGGVLLNAVFLDSLEADVERLERINRTIALVPPDDRQIGPTLRQIPILVLRPSADLGDLAVSQHQHLPRSVRYLLRGIGVADDRGADLLSYLAFAPSYIGQLLDLGRRDTLARRREIERFFAAESADSGEAQSVRHPAARLRRF